MLDTQNPLNKINRNTAKDKNITNRNLQHETRIKSKGSIWILPRSIYLYSFHFKLILSYFSIKCRIKISTYCEVNALCAVAASTACSLGLVPMLSRDVKKNGEHHIKQKSSLEMF